MSAARLTPVFSPATPPLPTLAGHAFGNFALELDDSYLMCGALAYDSTFIRMDKQTGKELSRWTFDGGAKDACESVVALPGGGFAVAGKCSWGAGTSGLKRVRRRS